MKRWPWLKDVVLTGLGVIVIMSQVLARHPDGLLIGAGLALTVPSSWDHIRALMPGGGESSPSRQEPGPQESPPSQEEVRTGERN